MRIGVYVCHCGGNISDVVDIKSVVVAAKEQPDIALVRDLEHMCSEHGQKSILDDVKEHSLDKIVVAACSPLFHERTFMKTVEKAGLNAYVFEMANIREQCSWCHSSEVEASRKAADLVKMAISKCRLDLPLERKALPIGRRVLVVGGGIAGVQAALDLGDAGFDVYLVEKEPSIGGKMAMLSKTFPTEDCATCIIGPKLADAGEHPNIHLMTYSEIENVKGYLGNFEVTVKKKPRYINMEKCTACGDCVDKCPTKTPDLFNLGLSERRAVYIYNHVAVPHKYLIDDAVCRRLREGTDFCGGYDQSTLNNLGLAQYETAPCSAACPLHVNVQGYLQLVFKGEYEGALALIREANPFPGITGRVCSRQCEQACSRADVDESLAINLLKRYVADQEIIHEKKWTVTAPVSNGGKVAIIGSGPAGLLAAYDLRQKKYAVTVFERMSEIGGMLRYGIPSYRLPGEILDRDLQVLSQLGVQFVVNTEIKGEEAIRKLRKEFDAVFIAVGAWRSKKMEISGEELPGVEGAIEFLRRANIGEIREFSGKAAVVGGGNAAIDAARTLLRLGASEVHLIYRRTRKDMPANTEEIEEAEREGIKFQYLSSPTVIARSNDRLTVTIQKMRLGEPDSSGRGRPIPIEGSEQEEEFDLVAMAIGQEPETELLVEVSSENRLFKADPLTLETNLPGVFVGGDAVLGPATFIEAMAAGRKAAISIDRFVTGQDMRTGREKEGAWKSDLKVDTKGITKAKRAKPVLRGVTKGDFAEVNHGLPDDVIHDEVKRCLSCAGCFCEKFCEPKAIEFDEKPEYVKLQVDTIIAAMGYDLFDATEKAVYGYGKYPNVISALELERIVATATSGPPLWPVGKRVAFVQCVGSRDEQIGRENCSRICCMYATKLAQLLKRIDPTRDVYIFYTDQRAYGKGFEEYYKRAQRAGVKYIRGRVAEITEDAETRNLVLTAEDTLSRQIIQSQFDTVVLSSGLVPARSADRVTEMLRLAKSPDGFVQEAHPKFRPVDTLVDGVFVAGCIQGPKDIPDTIAQASAAAARAIRLMNRGVFEIEPVVGFVHEELCDGCGVCISNCPIEAISIKNQVAQINETICKGCGICIASCPKEALDLHYYTNDQMKAQIDAAVQSKKPDEVRILIFADSMCTYRLADNLGIGRFPYPAETRIIRVHSGSRVTPKLMLYALQAGADGIFVGECDKRASPYTGAVEAIERNVSIVRGVLRQHGITEERVRFSELLTSVLTDFYRHVANLVDLCEQSKPISEEQRQRLLENSERALYKRETNP